MAMGGMALAAPGNSSDPNIAGFTEVRDWSAIDTDKDGYVSADEMEGYLKHARQQPSISSTKGDETPSIRITEVRNWSAADTNKDGYISPDEMEAYLEQARERARTSTASGQEQKKSQ
jgi:Ca2+-binding EF-hand superfamily protein